MRLDAWLRQNRSLGERLRVVECLCQAVNAVHDRGQALAALEPSKVELGVDGRCDLAPAQKGTPSREYLAPDRAENGQPSSIADVYAAGAIAWEVLVGRSPGPSPTHVAEVRPEVPREVADAVMACLEKSPDWRPKDLTYLAQIAAAKQPASGRGGAATRGTRPARAARVDESRPARRTWPLLAALVVVLALAAAAGWHYLGPGFAGLPSLTGRSGPPAPPKPTTPPPASDSATPAPGSARPTPAPMPIPTPATEPGADTMAATPTPRAEPAPATPPPTPPPAPPAPATSGGPAKAPPPTSPNPLGALPVPEAAVPAPTPPRLPAELTAVSPLTVSRPGKVLLDVRGTSLRTGHRVQIVALRRAPSGISVVRQKLVSDTLITVLLDLSSDVAPGEYGVLVEEPQGIRSNTLVFNVEK